MLTSSAQFVMVEPLPAPPTSLCSIFPRYFWDYHMISKTSHLNGSPVLSALSFYLSSTTVCGHQNLCKATAVADFPGVICGAPAKVLPQPDTGQGSGLYLPHLSWFHLHVSAPSALSSGPVLPD